MRIRWTDEKVARRVREVAASLDLTRMPTASELRRFPDGNALAARIVRTGGFDHRADFLELPRAEHCSRKGWRWEAWFTDRASERGLAAVRQTARKAPFDVQVGDHRIDVKFAGLSTTKAGHRQWTFSMRAQVTGHRCDFYALVAILEDGPILFIVPAEVMPLSYATVSNSQRSRYYGWRDRWDLLRDSP